MQYIGIDNGISGAIAVISQTGEVIFASKMPVVPARNGKNELDIAGLNQIIQKYRKDSVAVIENAHAMPGQGVSSMFKFGKCFGIGQSLLCANGIEYKTVEPKKWQKEILPGLGDTKAESIDFVARKFTYVTKNHGISDALCMAEYARRTMSPTYI